MAYPLHARWFRAGQLLSLDLRTMLAGLAADCHRRPPVFVENHPAGLRRRLCFIGNRDVALHRKRRCLPAGVLPLFILVILRLSGYALPASADAGSLCAGDNQSRLLPGGCLLASPFHAFYMRLLARLSLADVCLFPLVLLHPAENVRFSEGYGCRVLPFAPRNLFV